MPDEPAAKQTGIIQNPSRARVPDGPLGYLYPSPCHAVSMTKSNLNLVEPLPQPRSKPLSRDTRYLGPKRGQDGLLLRPGLRGIHSKAHSRDQTPTWAHRIFSRSIQATLHRLCPPVIPHKLPQGPSQPSLSFKLVKTRGHPLPPARRDPFFLANVLESKWMRREWLCWIHFLLVIYFSWQYAPCPRLQG
jgi:hypothetical protein